MNIYEKLQSMRVKLQSMSLKKSGKNTYAGYSYYELGDFLPHINTLMMEHKVTSLVSFGERATLTLVNAEKPEERITFESPMESANLKGAHPIQNLGAVETYSRRYLYMTAFEIVESDALDATQGNDAGQQRKANAQQNQKGSGLSDETKGKLNKAINWYSQLTGTEVNAIMTSLKQAIGKNSKEYTEADAKKALGIIAAWQKEYIGG